MFVVQPLPTALQHFLHQAVSHFIYFTDVYVYLSTKSDLGLMNFYHLV